MCWPGLRLARFCAPVDGHYYCTCAEIAAPEDGDDETEWDDKTVLP